MANQSWFSWQLTVIDPVVVPIVAEILALWPPHDLKRWQVTRPVADTVAKFVALELQVAVLVTFCTTPLPYVAVAVSCNVPPQRICEGDEGVTTMDSITGAWQFTVVDPLILPLAAVIVAEPAVRAVALQVTRPDADTVATLGALEVQVTPVSGWAAPDEYVPVAVNCTVPPAATAVEPGVSAMDWSTGARQVTLAEPLVIPVAVALVAMIVADPWPVAFGLQLTRPADTVATLGALELQVADAVRFCIEPSV
jgi:hypothetical protein